jgi:hypothetical protein
MTTPRREWVSIAQASILGLLVTYYAMLAYALSTRASSFDFVQLSASSLAVSRGESPYSPQRLTAVGLPPARAGEPDPVHSNLNAPLTAVLLVPLTGLGMARSYLVWSCWSVTGAFVSGWLVWQGLRRQRRDHRELVWLWIALLAYYPTYTALMLGQVTFVTMVPIVGAWAAARRRRDRLAGVLLGLALHLKLFVALLAVLFAVRRNWTVVVWMAGSAAALGLLTLPFVGTSSYLEYAAALRSVTWFSNTWNASYTSFFTRILGGSENVPAVNAPALAGALGLLCAVITLVTVIWLTRRMPQDAQSLDRFDLGYGLTIASMLIISPLGWMYYFPFLALPGYAVWVVTRERRMRRHKVLLGLAWVLSTIPTQMVRAADANDPTAWFTLDSVYFYALVVLTGVVAHVLRQLDAPYVPQVGRSV